MAVQFSKRALAEFDAIFKRILGYSRDGEEYAEQVANLLNELSELATNPLLGKPLKGPDMEEKYRWLIGSRNQWVIYFLRPTPTSIIIMQARGAKMVPLTQKQIESAFKRKI